MKQAHWMMLTGEYPPQVGGVADYTQQVARALVQAGDQVEIWAPPCPGSAAIDQGVQVNRLPDHFGYESLRLLNRRLRQPDPRRIIMVQYVPHAFGYRAMNVAFCAWLMSLRGQRIWTMFHEVAFPFERHQPLRHRFLACVTHWMAFKVARASSRLFISTPAWQRRIAWMSRPHTPIQWMTIPSNLPTAVELLPRTGAPVIAHFGAYNVQGSHLGEEILAILQADASVQIWLLGRGGETLAAELAAAHPQFRGRLVATGALPAEQIAQRLASADVILQPYPDGVTTRRSSLMAALRLGRPIVTTRGSRTEPLWQQSGAVELVDAGDINELQRRTIALLHNPQRRAELSDRARQLYDEHFDVRHTIAILRQAVEAIS
jgi:glycosyltransferase involved in cell wall biosynthesis